MKRGTTGFRDQKIAPYLFCLPFILAILVVYAYPLASSIVMSFQKVKLMGSSTFVGLKNYSSLLNKHFYAALGNTFIYAFFVVITLIPISFFVAYGLNQSFLKGKGFFRASIFMPILTSTVICGMLFRMMFGSSASAMVNSMLIRLGILKEPVKWLFASKGTGIFILVIVTIWRVTGQFMVYFLSGLQGVPQDLYEAARIDGANGRQSMWYITLPSIKPTLTFIVTISIMGALSMFAESYTLWNNSTVGDIGMTIMRYLYEMGFYKNNYGLASATGIILLLLIFLVNFIQLKCFGFSRKGEDA